MDPNLITTTQAVDPVFVLIFGISLVLLLGITGTMVWFTFRYHRSRAPQPTSQVADNIWLEITWTALPTILVLGMFYYGWAGYLALRQVPEGALAVTAIARQWDWRFSYPNGKTSTELYVPAGKPVLVNLVSEDVIHGLFIPAFRVKRDVVPGMKNRLWFVATKPGSYDLFCSQHCGVGHSAMVTTVEALPEPEFNAWLAKGEEKEQKEEGGGEGEGRSLLTRHGCLGCHSLDGSTKVGPSLKGMWGRKVTVVTAGVERILTVNEAYLKQSIRNPKADVVKGFPPIMPTFPDLTDQEVEAMVEFIEQAK